MGLALSKFESEVDLKNIIAAMRISKFVAKMGTNKRQRNSIDYFRRYTIDDQDLVADQRRTQRQKDMFKELNKDGRAQLEHQTLEAEKEKVIEGCQPDHDPVDRRILFELTGRRFRPEDFPPEDETSQEEDFRVMLEDVLGFDELSDEEDTGGSGLQTGLLSQGK